MLASERLAQVSLGVELHEVFVQSVDGFRIVEVEAGSLSIHIMGINGNSVGSHGPF